MKDNRSLHLWIAALAALGLWQSVLSIKDRARIEALERRPPVVNVTPHIDMRGIRVYEPLAPSGLPPLEARRGK